MELRLKTEYIKKIKSDNTLLSKVADKLKISTFSLAYQLRKNGERFTQKNILILLSDYFGISEDELLEEVEETETA